MREPTTAEVVAEITGDPASMGYAGNTVSAVTALMNDKTLRSEPRETVTGAELFNAIDDGEFNALSDAQKADVDRITSLSGDIDVKPGSRARSIMLEIFGGGTTTRSNFQGLAQTRISRAHELGWRRMRQGWVARAMP